MSSKCIICRPDAGLNDNLTQIEVAYRYAEQTNRILIVDTNYKNALHFHDKFSNYFMSLDSRLKLDRSFLSDNLDSMTISPSMLVNRIDSYRPVYSERLGNFADSLTGLPLTFDFSRHYDEEILLHHACGGSQVALFTLKKLVLQETIVKLLEQRLNSIGKPYSAIHIRNTDYQTDYVGFVDSLKDSAIMPIFVATDSLKCREYCITALGSQNVVYFSQLPVEENPIHADNNFRSPFERNSEAILDLLTVALATKFYKLPLKENIHGVQYSGFSNLAENLIRYGGILASLLGSSQSAESILLKALTWRLSVG